MAFCEFDHPFGERCSPKVTVKPTPHLRRAFEFAPEIFAPERFILFRLSFQVCINEQFCGTKRVVDAFARHWISKARCVTKKSPAITASFASVPRARRQSGNARGVALCSVAQTVLLRFA